MLVVLLVIAILIIILVIGSLYMFNMAFNRNISKENVLNNDINNKSTKDKIVLPPNTKWLSNHCKQVNIKSFDEIRLRGYIVNKKNSKKWIILVHGFTTNHTSMINKGIEFYKQGFNILLVDLRAHGDSEGKYITMGVKDCYDIKQWVKYVVHKENAKEIGLFGVSMGAATVMMASGLDLLKEVKFVIEDCGYNSVWDELKYQLKGLYHLPSFPILYICEFFSKIIAKFDFRSYSPEIALSKTTIPILMIHGTYDTFVPFNMLEKNFDSCNSIKRKLIIEKANHAEAEDVDHDKYWKTIKEFIKDVERK